MTDSNEVTDATEAAEVDRRAALKKVAGFGAVAGAVWAAPAVNGLSIVPAYAAAQSAPTTTTEAPTTTTEAPTTTTEAPTTTSTSTTTTTEPPLPQIVATGTATKSLGCFGGLLTGNDRFQPNLGADGWWHFGFQGCSLGNSESVALIDPTGGPVGNAYRPPTGYQCKMELMQGSSVVYDTGYVSDPINGIADTGGWIFISTSQYPNGYGNMGWRITCDPI